MLTRMGLAGFGAGVLLACTTVAVAGPAWAAAGATVTLRCADADGPVDLRACLPESPLQISREGARTRYAAADLPALGPCETGTLTLTMPHNFSIAARNTGTGVTLSLTVAAPDGHVVHTAEAARFGTVQFYHCGPTVDPHCRDYTYDGPR
jgi:hypothetical protein